MCEIMLHYTSSDSIALLTIDRPHRRNALSAELAGQLSELLRKLDEDESIRAIVITGSSPGFCAGSDLKELSGMTIAEMCRHEADTAALARSIGRLSNPVIAAVDGFAMGGGFLFALSCDLVVTSKTCVWRLPEVSIGWIPPWGLEALVARSGPIVARRLAWGTEPIDGKEAYRLGVADYLAASADVTMEAMEIATKLAALPGPAVAATKRYFSAISGASGEVRDYEASLLFAENCEHDAAKATLQKFGMKI